MLDKFEGQSFLVIHLLGENATGAIALATPWLRCSIQQGAALRRCRPCRARLRLQVPTVSQAGSMLPETPATP